MVMHPVPTSASVQDFLASKDVKTIPHSAFLLVSVPADVFLFPRLKSELADLLLSHDSFKTSLEGVVWTIAKDEFADASRRRIDRCCDN
jgi:hypothetical protein